MELVPENFPRPPPDPPQTWNAYDDMTKWEKETGYKGDDLYRDWVTSWLMLEPIHTGSEPALTSNDSSESSAAQQDSEEPLGVANATADLDCGLEKISTMDCANNESSMTAVSSDESILQDIYDHRIVGGKSGQNERGATVMMQSIPYNLLVEPDLLDLLRQTCEMDHVEYIYIPTCTETRSGQSRNKGYCFIHFSVAATAQEFASRTHGHVFPCAPGEKRVLINSMAKFQGLYTNLMNVLEIHAKKWRPKNGFAHIRTSKVELVCVGLLPLRNLVKRRIVDCKSIRLVDERWHAIVEE